MFSQPVTSFLGAGAQGAPAKGLVLVDPSMAAVVLLGFLALSAGALWLAGGLSKQPQTDGSPAPARYREAA